MPWERYFTADAAMHRLRGDEKGLTLEQMKAPVDHQYTKLETADLINHLTEYYNGLPDTPV